MGYPLARAGIKNSGSSGQNRVTMDLNTPGFVTVNPAALHDGTFGRLLRRRLRPCYSLA